MVYHLNLIYIYCSAVQSHFASPPFYFVIGAGTSLNMPHKAAFHNS